MPHKDPATRAAYLADWRQKNGKQAGARHYRKHKIKKLAQHREWRLRHPEWEREWRRRHPQSSAERVRKATQQRRYIGLLRLRALDRFGGRCLCCGETRHEFLTFDHVHGDGAAERKRGIGGSTFYLLLLKTDAIDRYRVLCWNCNCARG